MLPEPKKAAAPAGAGQPQTPPAPPAQDAAQPQFVTLDVAQRMAQEAEEKAFRRAQSLLTTTSQGIEKRVQAQLQALEQTLKVQKAAGIQFTPEQETAMRQHALYNAYQTEPPPQAQPGAPAAQPAGAAEEPPNEVTAMAWEAMEEAGVIIYDKAEPENGIARDIEANMLDYSSPRKFLKSIDKAIAAKQARLGQAQPPAQPPTQPTNQPPRMPTNAGGAGAPAGPRIDPKNMDDLYKRAFGGNE